MTLRFPKQNQTFDGKTRLVSCFSDVSNSSVFFGELALITGEHTYIRPTPSYRRVFSGSEEISVLVSLACFWTRVSWSIWRSASFTFCCVSIIFSCSSANACRDRKYRSVQSRKGNQERIRVSLFLPSLPFLWLDSGSQTEKWNTASPVNQLTSKAICYMKVVYEDINLDHLNVCIKEVKKKNDIWPKIIHDTERWKTGL